MTMRSSRRAGMALDAARLSLMSCSEMASNPRSDDAAKRLTRLWSVG